jgi:hypothetical protein
MGRNREWRSPDNLMLTQLPTRRNQKHGHWAGDKASPTYCTWKAMISRCTRKDHKSFSRYGGRNISVCERWMTFQNFLEDMGVRPSKDHSIDRIDVDGDYEPLNCRWANSFQQQHVNKSDVKLSLDDVHRIKVLRLLGFTQAYIAEIFGVHQGHVSRVVNCKRWAEVTQERRG